MSLARNESIEHYVAAFSANRASRRPRSNARGLTLDKPFISKTILFERNSQKSECEVAIFTPSRNKKGTYSSLVRFDKIEKYTAEIRGSDEFNAVECALSYVSTVIKESTDPLFIDDIF